MNKKKASKAAPSVAAAQVRPPQSGAQQLDQMKPAELMGKVLAIQLNPVGIEGLIRQVLPASVLAELDVRLTHVEASTHTSGHPVTQAWVVFAPRAKAAIPTAAAQG